jgi:hypothetical protein
MNAIVPINVAAVRVNINDATKATPEMKGRTAVFEKMPFLSTQKNTASTGDKIYNAIETQTVAANSLDPGVHLHWELPDCLRRGVQPPEGGLLKFPAAPNRWLVIRHFSLYDGSAGTYGAVMHKAWIVESDFLSPNLIPDHDGKLRPAISVPLSLKGGVSKPVPPYLYMGRKLDYEDWNPDTEKPQDYLPFYRDQPGAPAYLDAIGFVGPSFAGYYPECNSVFGYWDRFEDLVDVNGVNVAKAVANNMPLQFRVSYQVFGWIEDKTLDPAASFDKAVRDNYQAIWEQWQEQGTNTPTKTPADVAEEFARTRLGWLIEKKDISFTLDAKNKIATLTVPERTLCCGQMQEIVWNMLDAQQQTIYFLANPTGSKLAVWTDTVKLAVGNTPVEGLSALLKHDLAAKTNDPHILDDYETLLNAFQLGLLTQLEQEGTADAAFELDEALHSRAFAHGEGGYTWVVTAREKTPADKAPNADEEVTLPLELAEKLNLLNEAQKNYDQGRERLAAMRKQLFKDWLRFVKCYNGENKSNVSATDIMSFLGTGKTGERAFVIQQAAEVGLLGYQQDANGKIVSPLKPEGTTSLAYKVWDAFELVNGTLGLASKWKLVCAPSDPFWVPTDIVALVEGERIEPVRRNGSTGKVFVRVSAEIVGRLGIEYDGNKTSIDAASLSGLIPLNAHQPMSDDVTTLVGETALLTPMLAGAVADALEKQSGPVKIPRDTFIAALNAAQGGLSPLDPANHFTATGGGLYTAVRQTGFVPEANPAEAVTSPQGFSATFTFTNATARGFAPNVVGWNAQTVYLEFTAKPGYTRNDPFLPVFLIWETQLDPLVRDSSTPNDYSPANLKDHFTLDGDDIDYVYPVVNHAPKPFTTGNEINYRASVVLSKRPVFNLTAQVDIYAKQYPDDPYLPKLKDLAEAYKKRRIMSQALDGWSELQTLRKPQPKVIVENLTNRTDPLTPLINKAATESARDNWYRFGFNGQTPTPTGDQAIYNFGPARSGFAAFLDAEIVDVFGQRMQLETEHLNPDGTLETIASIALRPAEGDDKSKDKIYLPPRLFAHSRLWFRWISARHVAIPGISDDFVEMNTRPSTSPIFGWIVPNHLDLSLFFYDHDGAAIGSFGLEHDAMVYRTRAGNFPDSLANDIGTPGDPKVNPHLAQFMWFVNDHSDGAEFLKALMRTLEDSELFLNAPSFAQDAGLAVLIGRPAALARTVLALETAGGVLPLSQADLTINSAFPQDVLNKRYDYIERQKTSAAALSAVEFPVRLGDLAKATDGLIAFLPENATTNPYETVYSPSAPADGKYGVERPKSDTVQLALNAAPETLTLLLDPRAAIHATTGILPVAELGVPADQYAKTMRELAMTFSTHPVLGRLDELVIPLPSENGLLWSWVQPEKTQTRIVPLEAQAANDTPRFGYTPQMLLEGWLRLESAPPLDAQSPDKPIQARSKRTAPKPVLEGKR